MLVKSQDVSDSRFGAYPGKRSVEELIKNGLVVIDKPAGPTSHQVTAWVRDMFSLSRAGHSGTLDPKVTGILVITLENGTKVMPALMGLEKEYVAVMGLHKDLTLTELRELCKKFSGKITQKPPRKSAVKRVERVREIYEIEVLELHGRDALLRIKCQAGTYIRKLISDMGLHIGGAHMKELRRTWAGRFGEKDKITLQDLKDAYEIWKETGDDAQIRDRIRPVEAAVEHLHKIVVKDTAVDAICNGAPLASGGVAAVDEEIEEGELIALTSIKGELVAIGAAAASGKDIEKRKIVAAKVDRVIMKRGLYPRTWGSRTPKDKL